MEMALKIMLVFMTALTMVLSKTSNPFVGSLVLVLLTIVMMFDIGILVNQWVAYLMMLLFLGGMMVMFLYVTSIMTTLKFKLNLKGVILYFSMGIIIWVTKGNDSMKGDKFLSLSDFFNLDNYLLIMVTLVYLLLGLIAVVNISKKFDGALKSQMND
uniref:NADH dehydrogenase subunit 6 n=1 Tax=Ergasilus tumidus TaxID=342420 RepID=UPI002434F28F|nr:NADH dehydrogenase subunit 6 [Ergasilus tumidus]WEU66990.1 NADH dehydrogenase subunit 6 [Ergasilus tumidus]